MSSDKAEPVYLIHPGHKIVDPNNSVNPEPKLAVDGNHPTIQPQGANLTFGLSAAQLALIKSNNGWQGGSAMTRDGQGAGGGGQ